MQDKSFAKTAMRQILNVKKPLLFTLVMLIIIRIGSQLPVPGLDADYFAAWFSEATGDSFSLLNAFTGGSFTSLSLFAVGITPYITASIIVQLLGIAIPKIEELQKQGESGQKRIAKGTRYLALALAAFESIAMAIAFSKQGVLNDTSLLSIVTTAAAFTAGTAALIFIGDEITENGIGNGVSVILLINILSSMPSDFAALFDEFVFSKSIASGIVSAVVIIAAVLLLTLYVVILNDAERRIPIQSSAKMRGYAGKRSFPIKVNTGGVIPVIFASSVFAVPQLVSSLMGYSGSGVWSEILRYLSSSYWFKAAYPKYTAGLILYILLLFGFAYFYAGIAFNTYEVSENLRKNGALIPGIRPGKPTKEYLNHVLKYIIFIGAGLLSTLCVVFYVLSGVFNLSLSFGATSLIIIVSVIMEIRGRIRAASQSHEYKKFV